VVAAERPKLMLLCNPHNPAGKVMSKPELEVIAEVAEEFDVVVAADEIHADLIHVDKAHVPFASLGPEVLARTITMTSATKAFNLASIRCAVAHVGHQGFREAREARPGHLFGAPSSFGVAATLAAWQDGDEWLKEVKVQLDHNRHLLGDLLARHIPQVGYLPPEATYLAWLDCSRLGLGDEPAEFFLDKAGVAVNSGPIFGSQGAGHVRMNFATSTEVLTTSIERMAAAIANR
jgi:cystathionine beta-lyase